MKLFLFHFVFLFFCLSFVVNASSTIIVENQNQFETVVERINKGEELSLKLAAKTFVLKTQIKAKAPLKIYGQKSTILCYTNCYESSFAVREEDGYYVYKQNTSISPYSLFFDEHGNIVEVSESVDALLKVNLAKDGLVAEPSLGAGTIVKLPIDESLRSLKNKLFSRAFGYFDCGWQTVNFILERTDKDYLYCKTLNNCRTGNYNYDLKVYKKPVRYVIYNAERKDGSIFYDAHFLYVPKKFNRVYHVNCTDFNSPKSNIIITSDFSMKGVSFVGLDGIEVNSSSSAICEIKDCFFRNCLGTALKITRKIVGLSVREANVKNCTFIDCSTFGGHIVDLISPFEGGNYFKFTGCRLGRYHDGKITYKNPTGGIWVDGNAEIEGNVVYNTPRCHLYFNKGVIVALGNVLYNTDEFNELTYRNLSSDWGLVYCNHIFNNTKEALENKTHRILLEKNLLYGAYTYVNEARGIYIDDGRGDVECRDNIILNTQSFSIDSRNVKLTDASSARNRFTRNIVSSRYKLAAGPSVKGSDAPVSNGNISFDERENVTSGLQADNNNLSDKAIMEYSLKNGKILVTRELYNKLRKSKAWRKVGNYFLVK